MDVCESLKQLRKERELMIGLWREIENAMWRHIISLLAPLGGFAYFSVGDEWRDHELLRK